MALVIGAASIILGGAMAHAGPADPQPMPAKQLRLQIGDLQIRTMARIEVEDRLVKMAAAGARRHAIIELASALPDRAALKAAGIELQSSLGGRTWIASVDPIAAAT